jgi:hypothetical protein
MHVTSSGRVLCAACASDALSRVPPAPVMRQASGRVLCLEPSSRTFASMIEIISILSNKGTYHGNAATSRSYFINRECIHSGIFV